MLRFPSVLDSVVAHFRDFVYPPVCFVCERPLEDGNQRVCTDCWSSFQQLHEGEPVWHELNIRFAEAGFISGLLSCYYFEKEGPLQKVIHMLKYDGMKSMGELLGRDVGLRMREGPEFLQAD
jgi:predicted amidophosphoribosyltransferase